VTVQLFFSTGQNGVAKEPAMLELNIVTAQPNVISILFYPFLLYFSFPKVMKKEKNF
jgi:hypothetical protein